MTKWTQTLLDDVCLLITDGSHYSPSSVEVGYPMVSVKDFSGYGFDFSNCRQISKEDYEALVKNGCRPEINDILVGKDGARYFEDVIIYKQEERPVMLSSIAIIRANTQKIIPKFLFYYLFNKELRQKVKDNLGSGSAIPRMVLKDFKRIPISYPDIKTQCSIAATLSSLDDKIELNNRIIANLETQAQTIFKSWFVDFEPFQNGEFEESELGLIPKGWRVDKIGSMPILVTDFVANGSFASLKENVTIYDEPNYAFFIRNTDLKSQHFGKYVDKQAYDFLSKSRLVGGEVIISNVGDVGSVFLCPILEKPMTLGNNVILVNTIQAESLNWYLYMLFRYFYGKDLIQGITSGSAQPKFNKTDFRALKIIIPPLNVLVKYNEKMNGIFSMKSIKNKENIYCATIRDTLLPKLMSGEIEVPVER